MTAPWIALLILFSQEGGQAQEGDRLARARAAIGDWEARDGAYEGRGTGHAFGRDGTLRVVHAADGRFRVEFASALPDWAGFDGRVVWTRDRTGLARVIELEEADRWRMLVSVLSGAWAESKGIEAASRSGDAPAFELRISGAPLVMTLTLDKATLLPAELVEQGTAGEKRWSFSDYRAVGGRRLAHAWTFHEQDTEERYAVASFAAVPVTDELFRAPLAPPKDVSFDPEMPAELEVSRMTSGHLLVEPLVEDDHMGSFIFDTGAGISVIDAKVADELGLETLGSTIAEGVAGVSTSRFRRGERFQLGPVIIEDPIYGDIDLSFLQPAFGRKVIGIVGYDLLARCVAEIEPATAKIALYDPATYTLAGGKWQDLVLHENNPCARGRYEGDREGLFRLDTGATDTVTFHAPAVRAFKLLEGRKVMESSSGGVGGSASSPQGVLEWFELGGHRFEKPKVEFSQAESGAFTDIYLDGNVGQAFLKPFRIVLDYRGDRIAFVERE